MTAPAFHSKRGERACSEILLDFGAPLLEPLGSAPLSVWRDALTLVVTTWNALVIDEALGGSQTLTELRVRVRLLPEPGGLFFADAVEALVIRKQEHFGEERWTVGHWKLTRPGGELRLRVEVHAPPVRPP